VRLRDPRFSIPDRSGHLLRHTRSHPRRRAHRLAPRRPGSPQPSPRWRVRHNLKITDFSNGWRGGWFGNAKDWAANAINIGLVVNSTPAVNSVAVLPPGNNGAGAYGHVAFVLSVGNGTATVEDYNYADGYDGYQSYAYSQHTIYTSGVSFMLPLTISPGRQRSRRPPGRSAAISDLRHTV
jgi:hypothetical protein